MIFRKNCSNLDRTKMEAKIIEKKTIRGTEKIRIPMYSCEAKDGWIDSCPGDCKLFKEK